MIEELLARLDVVVAASSWSRLGGLSARPGDLLVGRLGRVHRQTVDQQPAPNRRVADVLTFR